MLEIAKIHKGEFRITANQNLIIAGVPESEKAKIEKIAQQSGLMNAVTPQRENSMACVSFPTCPLAMAEAERFLPTFIDSIDALMAKYALSDENIVLRVTGCPNGCGRAMLAEVGLGRESAGTLQPARVVTVSGRVFHGCSKRTSPRQKFWPCWMN